MDGHVALSWAITHIKQTMLSSLRDLPKRQSCSHKACNRNHSERCWQKRQ